MAIRCVEILICLWHYHSGVVLCVVSGRVAVAHCARVNSKWSAAAASVGVRLSHICHSTNNKAFNFIYRRRVGMI